MSFKRFGTPLAIGAFALALGAGALTTMLAQQSAGRGPALGQTFFAAVDANKDGAITRDELRAAMAKWLAQGSGGSLDQDQLSAVLGTAFPQSEVMAAFSGGRGPQPQTAKPEDVAKMMAALPSKAPAKPAQPRKILVLAKANGFVHSCIPLAAKTVEEIGKKTGAWTTAVSYDPSVITAENLKQYDVLLLDNTTGAFLDEPGNQAVHDARKKALLDFVRSGKGLVGIHAATDSYHQSTEFPGAGRGRGGRGAMGSMMATSIMTAADKNSDKKLAADELQGLADSWFDRLDREKSGRVSQANFLSRISTVAMGGGGAGRGGPPAKGRPGRDTQTGTWPEFNHMIGGYFKWHWLNPTHIVYKIDDPASPLTTMFRGGEFALDDETYTFSVSSWSRENLRVLTSVDYAKMSEEDKLKEDFPREDHDYGLSWIRREGNGRVFYEAHGHDEHIYGITKMLEHLTAGIQYAAGDLKANDAPSKK